MCGRPSGVRSKKVRYPHCRPCMRVMAILFTTYHARGLDTFDLKIREEMEKRALGFLSVGTRLREIYKIEGVLAYGGKCLCCGETTLKLLTLEHRLGRRRDPIKGSDQWAQLASAGYPKDRYEVLCFNCNLGKAINKGVCPHKEKPKCYS